jgi:hypothetical protein
MHIFLINIKTQEIQWLITMKLVKKSGTNVKESLIMFLLELELEEQ